MEIYHNTVTMDIDEFKKLVNGRFRVFPCTQCFGKGWYWVHEDGTKRDPTDGEDEFDFYEHPCNDDEEDCGGAGFRVVLEETEN